MKVFGIYFSLEVLQSLFYTGTCSVDEYYEVVLRMITDIQALKKWNEIPQDMRDRIIDNVFCSACTLTKIVDYSITMESGGLLLTGKCAKCGQPVARFVEGA